MPVPHEILQYQGASFTASSGTQSGYHYYDVVLSDDVRCGSLILVASHFETTSSLIVKPTSLVGLGVSSWSEAVHQSAGGNTFSMTLNYGVVAVQPTPGDKDVRVVTNSTVSKKASIVVVEIAQVFDGFVLSGVLDVTASNYASSPPTVNVDSGSVAPSQTNQFWFGAGCYGAAAIPPPNITTTYDGIQLLASQNVASYIYHHIFYKDNTDAINARTKFDIEYTTGTTAWVAYVATFTPSPVVHTSLEVMTDGARWCFADMWIAETGAAPTHLQLAIAATTSLPIAIDVVVAAANQQTAALDCLVNSTVYLTTPLRVVVGDGQVMPLDLSVTVGVGWSKVVSLTVAITTAPYFIIEPDRPAFPPVATVQNLTTTVHQNAIRSPTEDFSTLMQVGDVLVVESGLNAGYYVVIAIASNVVFVAQALHHTDTNMTCSIRRVRDATAYRTAAAIIDQPLLLNSFSVASLLDVWVG